VQMACAETVGGVTGLFESHEWYERQV